MAPKMGPCSRNVQKLNHEDLPVRKYNVVQAVGLGNGRRHTVIRSEHLFHEASVQKITYYQSQKAQKK